jgi:ABC transport system ATP-binding/permease protein
MALVELRQLSIGFRGPSLLEEVNCLIEPGERIGLLGRNGAGKTTLMRLLSGQIEPDHGKVLLTPGKRVAVLPQDVPQSVSGTIHEIVLKGLAEVTAVSDTPWKADQKVEQILSRMELDGEARFELLSSGMKRRVLLAQSLVSEPDLLLLDEPTNHLDIAAINWLEDFLARWNTTFLFVTHDRVFLQKLATRILEIDRGRLFDWACDYETFLERKEAWLAAEESQSALFDKKLAQEEVWIRTGVKARRTRNQGRVRALEAMRLQHQQRRTQPGQVQMEIQTGQKSGQLVAEAKNVSFAYENKQIVTDFTTTIMRGDKVGVIGPNGVGKTTLLRVLLGELAPQAGTMRLGTNLQIAYFDQLREQLDDEASVQDNIADGNNRLLINNQQRHVIGYLQDFLFTPERARQLVKFLSGGERNRLLLARLFAKPANVIVLDEPTNDLDAETLELLESLLVEFAGTVLLVSHDRAFLNNVVTSTIVFEDGDVREFDGGYDDWQRAKRNAEQARQKEAAANKAKANAAKTSGSGTAVSTEPAAPKRKMSFNEKRELETLPATIERLERQIGDIHNQMVEPGFFQQPGETISRVQLKLKDLEAELATCFERWELLEELAN